MAINSWQDWKVYYQDKLTHVAGYEEQFVDTILRHIPEISYQDVIPQYHFLDSNCQNRYIDFVIQNQEKNWNIAIELDGLAKLISKEYVEDYQQSYQRFDDMLRRQNDIIHQGFVLLRFTNKTMVNKPEYVIECIQMSLNTQTNKDNTIKELKLKLRASNLLVEWYKDEIDELNQPVEQYSTLKYVTTKQLNNLVIYSGTGFKNRLYDIYENIVLQGRYYNFLTTMVVITVCIVYFFVF
ncbi:hypothetical protein ACF3NV_07870 [Moraxella atlantae]|uniref:hypothetical protein n=1 Tax=Faucicola atlantae TaxID=34059 RepID=UPI003750650E